jgi:hypothetical protein
MTHIQNVLDKFMEPLRCIGLSLCIITRCYDENYWDEALRGAACLYVEDLDVESQIVRNAWPIYVWPDGRTMIPSATPAEIRAVLEK